MLWQCCYFCFPESVGQDALPEQVLMMHATAKSKKEQMEVIQSLFKKDGSKWKVAEYPNLKLLGVPSYVSDFYSS